MVHLEEWIPELRESNEVFITLEQSRFHETAIKSHVDVKAVRKEVDATYDNMVSIINVKALTEPSAALLAFMEELNSRILYYNDLVVVQIGHHAAQAAKKDAAASASQDDPNALAF